MKDSPIKLPEMNSNEFAQNKFYVFTTVIVKAIIIQLKRLAFTGRNIETNKWNLRKKNYRDAAFINVLSVGRNLEGNIKIQLMNVLLHNLVCHVATNEHSPVRMLLTT